ncbi:MAG: hypothetical protein HC942_17635, partial [Microcoleus sp. SU_5_6]|nr:hypothetical protein [Microcoleus sp. SU_5_6]
MLSFVPDWRWMLSGETNPWYPTARLFRQQKIGDWEPVFDRVKTALVGAERLAEGVPPCPPSPCPALSV